ncbi:hypothetical protein G7046_g6048 [Stylonectria norvegica]|nr:hypothetical protein G7046_g6048 [Stylonectria norvegica]
MRVSFTVATLLAASLSQAQYLISELSFGHAGRISPAESRGEIPQFTLLGKPNPPEVLSNRIILTPLAPGNQRGAVWSEQTLLRDQWIADVDFRVNGQERGGGNLNIWLARTGTATVGAASIYSVGKFDGLALVIDSHGGNGGMIRGFLNDGSTDYSQQPSVDELAFGHCQYSYRNLGRPSQIKMRQTADTFKVEIDGKLCFESEKITLPTGYQIGITAATPDNPDSFEVFKLVVMTDNTASTKGNNNNNGNGASKQRSPSKSQPDRSKRDTANNGNYDDIPDEDSDVFSTSKTQFMDLHNRLQNTNHQLSNVHRTVSRHQQQDEKRHDEVTQLLSDIKSQLRKLEEVGELSRRIQELEKEVKNVRNDLTIKLQANERNVKNSLTDHHTTLSQHVVDNVPGHGKLIFVFIGTQVVFAAAYILYKRRRANMPKKYL